MRKKSASSLTCLAHFTKGKVVECCQYNQHRTVVVNRLGHTKITDRTSALGLHNDYNYGQTGLLFVPKIKCPDDGDLIFLVKCQFAIHENQSPIQCLKVLKVSASISTKMCLDTAPTTVEFTLCPQQRLAKKNN